MTLKREDVIRILNRISDRMISQAEYLSELDAVHGDAEHGINMKKGFSALKPELAAMEQLPIDGILKQAGKIIMSKTGGSAGALYGTAFLEASKAAAGKEALDAETVGAIIDGALKGMMRRGGAQPGDKTMIDTIYPASVAYQLALSKGMDLQQCCCTAREAARKGMEHTKELIAHRGRASYQGDNSKGAQDPGATSMYYFFEQADAYIQTL